MIGWPSSFQTACFNEEAGLADLRRAIIPFARRLFHGESLHVPAAALAERVERDGGAW